ncbi:DinB family protein [Nocardioidaceae bacterium]|nr:DinB family protein [Nocardioidaceae bacterium]
MTEVSAHAVLRDSFVRVHELVPSVLEWMSPDDLTWRPGAEANPVGWLVWHLARVQDDHVADLAGREQVWTARGFHDRSGLPYDPDDIGFGHSSEQVGAWRVDDLSVLTDYHEAVHTMTLEVVGAMSEADLARVVDERWDPPVTAQARLVSVIGDTTQHVGQAAYVKGLLRRR